MPKPSPRTVLLTGFDPFGGDAANPSWSAVQQLHGETIGRRIVAGATD
jgi:pyroglutamyl-peptidase